MGPLISAPDLAAAPARYRLLDARPAAARDRGGIAGALGADLERHLSTAADPGHDPARGGRHPLPARETWARQLAASGIGPATPVVVYDEASGASAAARLWWMLRASGHAAVAVLDGGLPAALAAGLSCIGEPSGQMPLEPAHAPAWSLPMVDLAAVADRAQDPAWIVLDVRSPERFRGETEPLDPVAGHIPGARNLFYGENLGPDGRFKAPADLRAMYLGLLEGRPADRLVVHCGSGVTACHTLLALELAGLPGASLYVGSWSEWCRSGREIARG